MENVSGLVKGKMRLVFAEMMRELKDSGYDVSARLLNAMYFHVPQSRARLIFVGLRNDLEARPSHPRAQSRPYTVKEAIGQLPPGLPGEHSRQVKEAWYRSRPNQSLRKACRFVGSFHSARLDPDQPSPAQIRAHLHWHWRVSRHLTIQEAAILHSFPAAYQWAGPKSKAKEQIGNSVPPLFMRAIALHVKGLLGG